MCHCRTPEDILWRSDNVDPATAPLEEVFDLWCPRMFSGNDFELAAGAGRGRKAAIEGKEGGAQGLRQRDIRGVPAANRRP